MSAAPPPPRPSAYNFSGKRPANPTPAPPAPQQHQQLSPVRLASPSFVATPPPNPPATPKRALADLGLGLLATPAKTAAPPAPAPPAPTPTPAPVATEQQTSSVPTEVPVSTATTTASSSVSLPEPIAPASIPLPVNSKTRKLKAAAASTATVVTTTPTPVPAPTAAAATAAPRKNGLNPNFKPPADRVAIIPAQEILKQQVVFRDQIQDKVISKTIKQIAQQELRDVIFDNLPLQVALNGSSAFGRAVGQTVESAQQHLSSAASKEAAEEEPIDVDAAAPTDAKPEASELQQAVSKLLRNPTDQKLREELCQAFELAIRSMIICNSSKKVLKDGVQLTTQSFFAHLGSLNRIAAAINTDASTGHTYKDKHQNSGADFRLAYSHITEHLDFQQLSFIERQEHDALRELDRYFSYARRLKNVSPKDREAIKQSFAVAYDALLLEGLMRMQDTLELYTEKAVQAFKETVPEPMAQSPVFELWSQQHVSHYNLLEQERARGLILHRQFKREVKKINDAAVRKDPKAELISEPPPKKYRGTRLAAAIYSEPVAIAAV